MITEGIAKESELVQIENDAKKSVKASRKNAWNAYKAPILKKKEQLLAFSNMLKIQTHNDTKLQVIFSNLDKAIDLGYKDIISAGRQIKMILVKYPDAQVNEFLNWLVKLTSFVSDRISSHLYTVSKKELLAFKTVPASYDDNSKLVDGRVIIRDNFELLLKKHDNLLIFGEDVGKIGDVNHGLEGLQTKFGELRIFDTGIREATIAGQGIGLALRGLRPIAEIQYLDYILYCIQILSDDLASMNYRTIGKQIAPLIIRTRGHRLEGIWHSGSPMGGMIHLLRGIHILVPRNMTQAAGFYNTLLQIEQPAIVIESLNGYGVKESIPSNLGEFTIALGKIEVVIKGNDVTVISYGSTLRIVEATSKQLEQVGIHIEVIDIQSLIPFDLNEDIRDSILKTNRLLIVDEDVPGGASSYILQQLIEKQNIYSLLDSAPQLLSAKAHRPAYGGDGDYFSKPSEDDIFEAVYAIMHEANPIKFPL